MLRHYLNAAWRSLRRGRTHSAVNILGLTLGLTVVILILLWVRDERSFDRFHANFDRIHRVVADWSKYDWNGVSATPMPLAPLLTEELPEVKGAVRLRGHNPLLFRRGDKAFYENRGLIADPSLFEVFSFRFLRGTAETAFRQSSDVVIAERLALKYFGDKDPLGQVVEIDGKPATISGVVADPPANSTLQFDFLHSFAFISEYGGWGVHWGAMNFTTFLLLRPDADPAALGSKITDIARKNGSPQVAAGAVFRLQPLSDVHLDARAYSRAVESMGDRKSVRLFSAVAVFILLIACVNFMNLSTARASQKAREVGLRKTVGASKVQIIGQYLGESLVLTLISSLLALSLVRLVLPAFNRWAGKSIRLDLADGGLLLGWAAVVLITGLAAGIYPAFFLSSFRPAAVLRGRSPSGPRGAVFRRALVVLQFALSILLMIGTFVMVKQLRFIRTTDLGFDRNNVLQLPLKGGLAGRYRAFKSELVRLSQVVSVSAETYPFAESADHSAGNWNWEGRQGRESLDMVYAGVDWDFFRTMRLDIVAGRAFSPQFPADKTRAVIISEEAAKAMGLDDPVGKWLSWSKDERRTIVGVARNAYFRSFQFARDPLVYYLADISQAGDRGLVLVRLKDVPKGKGDPRSVLRAIDSVWKIHNPVTPFEYAFLDQIYEGIYAQERRTVSLFYAFAGLAVFISCLGLFGLTSFMTERRKREIGIRKILGAKEQRLVLLLSGEMVRWVILANILAWPVGYFAAKKLLEPYVYRVAVGLSVFALAGLLALFVAGLTVSTLAFRAARADPVVSIRNE